MFDQGVILWGEIRCWSLLGVKGRSILSLPVSRHINVVAFISGFFSHLIISLPLTETTLTHGLRKITFPYIFKTYIEIMWLYQQV